METITLHPKSKEKSPYNAAFAAKLKASKQQAKEGKTVKVTLNKIWK